MSEPSRRGDLGDVTPNVLSSIDLFAGAGGLTAGLVSGLSSLGLTLLTHRAVERDVAAAATFEANHGAGTAYAGSVEDWLETETVPEVDLVVGGPPCQGFSLINKARAGDLRNGLWERYAEVIALARPRWFVMENVPGFLRAPEFQQFRQWFEVGGILRDWVFEPRVLVASDYGAPQRRRRTIVLGSRRDVAPVAFPKVTRPPGRQATVREAFEGVRRAVTETQLPPRTTTFAGENLPGPYRTDELHLTRSYRELSRQRFLAIPAEGNRFDLPDDLKAPCWRNHHSGSGDVMGRLRWDEPSVTIRTEFFKPEKGRYIHPTEHRAITHLEAARLQGFPDDYLWVGSKLEIARQIGNAVPLALGEAIGRSVARAALGLTDQEPAQTLFDVSGTCPS